MKKNNFRYLHQEYATYSAEKLAWIGNFAKERVRYLKDYIADKPFRKILELGCGEGSLAYEVKKISNSQVYGLDLSAEGVALARKRGILAKRADLNQGIPLPSNTFDLVFSDQLIEHVYDTDFLLKECHRILKRDGHLIIITPNLSFWMNRILFFIGIYPVFLEASLLKKTLGQKFLKRFIVDQEAMGHIRVFNLAALVDILELQGFTVEKRIGIPQTFNLSKIYKIFYDLIDWAFSKIPSFARDIMIVAKKTKT